MILQVINDYETLADEGQEHTAGTIAVTKAIDTEKLQNPESLCSLHLDFIIVEIDDFKNWLELEDKTAFYDNQSWKISSVYSHLDNAIYYLDLYLIED